MKIRFFMFLFLFLFSVEMYSQELKTESNEKQLSVQNTSQSLTETSNTFGIMGFLQMIFIFILLILAIYGLFFLIKKASSQKIEEDGIINLIDSKNLGTNKNLHLIKIVSEYYLISSTENSVNLISKIEGKDLVDELNLEISTVKSRNKNFKDLMGGVQSKNPLEFLKDIKNKIKKM